MRRQKQQPNHMVQHYLQQKIRDEHFSSRERSHVATLCSTRAPFSVGSVAINSKKGSPRGTRRRKNLQGSELVFLLSTRKEKAEGDIVRLLAPSGMCPFSGRELQMKIDMFIRPSRKSFFRYSSNSDRKRNQRKGKGKGKDTNLTAKDVSHLEAR